jgi:hypothetical protein
MRILEIGKYVSVAYAGMLLAEQGHTVIKMQANYEPVLDLKKGNELLSWLNDGKEVYPNTGVAVRDLVATHSIDTVISNVPTIAPDDCGDARLIKIKPTGREKGFDIFAQAQIFSELGFKAPFFIGDTVAGLFAAFLATSTDRKYSVVGQGEALQKIIEGELLVTKPVGGWDKTLYEMNDFSARVEYRGKVLEQPKWSRQDKLNNLNHISGRISFEDINNG